MSRREFEAPNEWVRRLCENNPLGWLDDVYSVSSSWRVPWDDGRPHPILMDWLRSARPPSASACRALDVGCGLGYNAEALAGCGYQVTAFDVSPAAIDICQWRTSHTNVAYVVADLRDPPTEWLNAFHLVFEAAVLQVMAQAEIERALRNMCSLVAPNGLLLMVSRLRKPGQAETVMPWHFSLDELTVIPREEGLELVDVTEVPDHRQPELRRARISFGRRSVP